MPDESRFKRCRLPRRLRQRVHQLQVYPPHKSRIPLRRNGRGAARWFSTWKREGSRCRRFSARTCALPLRRRRKQGSTSMLSAAALPANNRLSPGRRSRRGRASPYVLAGRRSPVYLCVLCGRELKPEPQGTQVHRGTLFIITPMTFQQLLQGAEVLSQSGNPVVAGVEYDSRRVRPGTVFVAIKGETSDGNRFIDQAIAAGAVAIVTDSAAEAPRPGVAWAQVVHGRRALARLSANFYKKRAERLAITGLTGTNGKSTTAFLL